MVFFFFVYTSTYILVNIKYLSDLNGYNAFEDISIFYNFNILYGCSQYLDIFTLFE